MLLNCILIIRQSTCEGLCPWLLLIVQFCGKIKGFKYFIILTYIKGYYLEFYPNKHLFRKFPCSNRIDIFPITLFLKTTLGEKYLFICLFWKFQFSNHAVLYYKTVCVLEIFLTMIKRFNSDKHFSVFRKLRE